MEHNLDDSLNLDSAVGEMGFEHGEETVESQVDITLETSQGDDIPMEFEHIEEQPMLMDTGNEEVIDFMGDQFPSFQEYSVQDEQHHDTASLVGEVNQLDVMSSQSETMIDLQFDSLPITSSVKEDYLPKIVAVKAAIPSMRAVKRTEAPRQVAIAPKPGRPPALAPKPVALVANRGLAKKVALAGIVQGNTKGSVLAQLGKQLVMVRSGVEQKIKLVAANTAGSTLQYVTTSSNQAQLISTSKPVNTSQTKPVMAKVIVQSSGQASAEPCSQSAVLTRLAPGAPRYVMQQRTVPIPLHNQLLITSPTKQGVKVAKKQQIIAFKSPSGKLVSATQVPTTKKVVITANPSQNVILKSTAQPKTAQVNKDATVVTAGQRSQLHQIHVPGKGIQYIRLITNQTTALKPAATKQATLALPAKSFVLTDSKGNVIQMSAEKMVSEPPALLTTRSDTPARFAVKPQKKFVRIAPVPSKATSQAVVQPRAAQSLLAPFSPVGDAPGEEAMAELLPIGLVMKAESAPNGGGEGGESGSGGDGGNLLDTKDALRALVADTIASEHQIEELDIEFDHHQSPIEHERTSSTDAEDSSQSQGPPLIMIPSYGKDGQGALPEDHSNVSQILEDSNGMVNEESESMRPYLSPRASQPLSDTDYVSNELGLRPRKACNCTKSQCLKLYCDCFANGEFCNQCNCNNCHNNLENEELRQKAIRACLDRNPNAFRPKIGKSKSSGPEVVRRHNKGCNCKRSGCLKNYCECYEAKIACTAMCKCVGCRNVEDTLEWRRDLAKRPPPRHDYRAEPHADFKQPCTFMTTEVIEAVCQCLLAAAAEGGTRAPDVAADPVSDVIDEFARCLQDIISASYQAIPLSLLDEGQT